MTTTRWMMVTAVVVGLLSSVETPTAHAQEVQVSGPLAGQPAVRHMRIYRENRFQLKPFAGFTLQDEFRRSIMFGLQAQFAFLDYLGIGVFGGYAGVTLDTNLAQQVEQRGITTDRNALSLPSRDFFADQTGQLTWMAGAQINFIPLRGKVSFFQKIFVDTDLYIFVGAAAVGVEERANVDEETCDADGDGEPDAPPPRNENESRDQYLSRIGGSAPCVNSQSERATRVQIAPTFGVGMTFFANDFLGITLEWRGLPFKYNTSGTDERGAGPDGEFPDGSIDDKDRRFQFNQMVNIGLSIYLPTAVKISE